MHWQASVCQGQVTTGHEGGVVHHHGEDALLHLSSVLGAKDDHFTSLEGHRDRCRAAHPCCESVGWEAPSIQDQEWLLLQELLLFLWLDGDKHVLHKERMVSSRSDDSHSHPEVLLPASPAVHHIQTILKVQVVHSALSVCQEGLEVQFHVDLSPPDIIARGWLVHYSLIRWGSPGLDATADSQCPRGNYMASLFVPQGMLVEGCSGRVVEDLSMLRSNILGGFTKLSAAHVPSVYKLNCTWQR
mmetsp:Transcript_14907/g.33527  ORF Transcript_14907/g.33527 Transcript_14907/m.33527 type:complete len:244 (-) Transcript_14907:249-980(-)